jgi:hypothetical protein
MCFSYHHATRHSDVHECTSIALFLVIGTTGFQGTDPATDLRSAGMLGLFQLLYFVKYYQELALKIFRFSKTRDTPGENFPFCLVSLNVTGIVLAVLREAKFDSFLVTFFYVPPSNFLESLQRVMSSSDCNVH